MSDKPSFTAQELHFVKQAVEQVNIKGKDTIFVAEVLIKLSRTLESQAKAEGLLPETGEPAPAEAQPPISPATGEPMQAVSMPDLEAPIPEKPKAKVKSNKK